MGFQALDAVAHSVLLTPERLGDIANTCPLRPWVSPRPSSASAISRSADSGTSDAAIRSSSVSSFGRSATLVAFFASWSSSARSPRRVFVPMPDVHTTWAAERLSAAPNVVTPRRSSTARTAGDMPAAPMGASSVRRVGARGRCTSTGAVKTASQARRMSSAVSKRSRASRRRAVRKNSVRPAAYERSNNSGSMVTSASPKPGCPPVIPYSGRRAVAISYSVTATAYRSAATS